jgi:membrane-associated phospholipid phosphatase
VVLFFLIYALFAKWTQRFIKDWIPFIILFLSFEALRAIPYGAFGVVHYTELATVELKIFGTIPTLVLQQFYRSSFLDYLTAFFYSLHFIIPTVFAFVLWRYSPKNYGKYVGALLLCSYAALITAMLYPTAPPWLAHPIPGASLPATRILYQVDGELNVPVYHSILELFQSDLYAAFPSLHAAYPWLVSLYAIKIKRAKALPILVLPVGVWFSAVYLGEHYVIDLIGGVAYSTCAYLFVEEFVPRLPWSRVKSRLRGVASKQDFSLK